MIYYNFKNHFELEKYDNGLLSETFNYEQTYNLNIKYRMEYAKKREEYIIRGHELLYPKQFTFWDSFVSSSAYGDNTWRGSCMIEATLQVMNQLTEGDSVENVFSLIDFINGNPIYNDLALGEEQAKKVVEAVATFHVRGEEFSDYVKQRVKVDSNYKVKTINE